MPQLQIPAELVILHLAMLAFLEKYQVCVCVCVCAFCCVCVFIKLHITTQSGPVILVCCVCAFCCVCVCVCVLLCVSWIMCELSILLLKVVSN